MNVTSSATAASPSPVSLQSKLAIFAGDIKIAHTVFALPFALLSTFLAAKNFDPHGWPAPLKLALILVCMITARTVAMAVNRLLDAKLDAVNPRTTRRAIPSGALSSAFYAIAVALCVFTFIASTAGFWIIYRNPWPLIFSVPVLAFLSAYPLLKRFSRLCHYYLGMALALAPVCAWIAIRGSIAAPPLWMAAAVVCWTAGFDIIYACQDYASDVASGIFSVPSKFGVGPALWISRATHLIAAGMLVMVGFSTPFLGMPYFVGVAVAILLLVIEQSLVHPNDLSKAGLAFFTVNGIISVLLGTLGIIDVLRR
ncbi:MAG TPA: 4-hydroxybenzoate octaprenyltransferase [Tepidisphaeraceae bacterium]|nr:4-hydroxybenzoate octaprenyltransferase [Tepidisphaeraceae bacterium]